MAARTAEVESGFVNEPQLELRLPGVREAAAAALRELDRELPLEVAVLIDGQAADASGFDSVDPCEPTVVVARAGAATERHADAAVRAATEGYADWGRRPADERAEVIRTAADGLRADRARLAALAVREAGKPWVEADGDVCEAIDFLEYYARGAAALGEGRPLIQVPGEHNTLRYAGRGVCAVIAPWNFPLAIATGMTAAALATGNSVVLKPAEQTPACAAAVVAALHAAGVPPSALHLLPGGDEPAKALVAHPGVHTIAFTGSCEAGLSILETAARVVPGQHHIKRVIAEMGGKNCIVVDADADLDDAVPAILGSAFGFAGQKCSAASRVLVHAGIHGELIERLAGAVETLRVGPAEDFAIDVPAVIDADSQERLRETIAAAEAAPHAAVSSPGDGFYVDPSLFCDLPPDSRIVNEEIFGPVLTVESQPDLETAFEIVESLPFALCGGLFSRSPATIENLTRRSSAGNFYVNREITGSMVGRQPFGGGRLSGTGPKAGGPDYLLQFVEAHSLTENTMRHGLVL